MRIVVVGGGVMGATLLAGFARNGYTDIAVIERLPERTEQLRADGFDVVEDVTGADVILLAVKPQDMLTTVDALSIPSEVLVISIAAGITTAALEAKLPGVAVIRAMPNTPALVGLGATAISSGMHATTSHMNLAQELLGTVGVVVVVPEEQQDAVTAVSGSGPAYLFYLAEGMRAGALKQGLSQDVAEALVRQTLLGAATLLAESDVDATELRRRVSSPNGTTVAAIGALDERGVNDAVAAAIAAAAARSRELSSG